MNAFWIFSGAILTVVNLIMFLRSSLIVIHSECTILDRAIFCGNLMALLASIYLLNSGFSA